MLDVADSIDLFWTTLHTRPLVIVAVAVVLAFAGYVLFLAKPALPDGDMELRAYSEWEPKPLFEPLSKLDVELNQTRVVDSLSAGRAEIDGREVVNMASFDFLGVVGDTNPTEAALAAYRKYGCGSCGPRGFYGTIDKHLEVESRFTRFFGSEDAILYSFGFATVASAIPAFAKQGDVIVCDKGVNFAVQTGVQLSRSTVHWYNHCDPNNLELVIQAALDQVADTRTRMPRLFVVTEGLFQNTGYIAPLSQIVDIANKYKFRVMVDDTYGVGVLGKNGRGTLEHCGLSVRDVLFVTFGLTASFASEGGVCVSSLLEVVDHQRLSGAGYCFSASEPTLLCAYALATLDILEAEPNRPQIVREKSISFRELLRDIPGIRINGVDSGFEPEGPLCNYSPIVHIYLTNEESRSRLDEKLLLKAIVDKVLDGGDVAVARAMYVEDREKFLPRPSIRLCISYAHTKQDLSQAAEAIRNAVAEVLANE